MPQPVTAGSHLTRPDIGPGLSYLVCTAPRTGSSLLCAALSSTGVAGKPAEYFDIHANNENHWRRHLGIANDAAYVTKVVAAGRTSNGVFGVKLHWHQGQALVAKLMAETGATPPDGDAAMHHLNGLLSARLGDIRYVWLRRRNLVAQAISYYRATRSNRWRVGTDETEAEIFDAGKIPFDFAAIDGFVKTLERFDRSWFQYFKSQQLRALVLVYEDFVAAQADTLRKTLGFLGIAADIPDQIPPAFRRQADATSAAWETRYRTLKAEGAAAPRYTPGKARARSPRPAALPRDAATAPKLIAYDLQPGYALKLEPATQARDWMDATDRRFAYRCLPMVIANQNGWVLRNRQRLTAIWDGNPRPGGVAVSFDEPCELAYASSHFGSGVLTFNVSYLFRTPPGYNLHVRGPVNAPKDGIAALEGIVETDWSPATFTMNWKFTRPDHPVVFEAGEPIGMISPLLRGDVERFQPEIQPISADPEWEAGYKSWSQLRASFNRALQAGDKSAMEAGWQRHYLLGVTTDAAAAPEHQTGLDVRPFRDTGGKQ